MTDLSDSRLYVALVHYPVIDKNGETIASAVTNLDLHDIARVCRTYGVKGYYVVTPLADQMALAERITDHWITGAGGTYNPTRRQALELIRTKANVADSVAAIAAAEGRRPVTVATTARRGSATLSCSQLRTLLGQPAPVLLAFGTAWGLADEFMAAADHILEPVVGTGTYNHLSVRSAVAIILDRVQGRSILPTKRNVDRLPRIE